MKAHRVFFVFGFLSLVQGIALAAPVEINEKDVLFGYEATFQTQELADKDGSYSFRTPTKAKLLDRFLREFITGEMRDAYVARDFSNFDFKPGVDFELPAWKDSAKLTLEPGCIEWNMSALPLSKLADRWKPVYDSADRAGLVPAAYQGGTLGGGGHIHVGGRTRELNPWMRSPTLLRNVLVLFHNHPSLIMGFAEAYDFGPRSVSIRSYHSEERQKLFEEAIAVFDAWVVNANARERAQAAPYLVDLLSKQGLIDHDNFINLENFRDRMRDPRSNDKFTVEFRNIRPLPSAEHVRSVSKLLFRILQKYSDTEYLEHFNRISREEYLNSFFGPIAIESDWEEVKRELGVSDGRLDSLVYELTRNPNLRSSRRGSLRVREAYSDLVKMGEYEEILKPLSARSPETRESDARQIAYRGKAYRAELLRYKGKPYLGAVVPRR